MTGPDTRVAAVSGANRGIGREVACQLAGAGYAVYLTARDPRDAQQAASELGAPTLIAAQLDVTDPDSVARLAQRIAAEHGHLHSLINNAAILYDTWQRAADADLAVVQQAMQTNLFGAWRLTQAMLPLLRRSGHARIVNVSSQAGSLTGMAGGTPAYRTSKAALSG